MEEGVIGSVFDELAAVFLAEEGIGHGGAFFGEPFAVDAGAVGGGDGEEGPGRVGIFAMPFVVEETFTAVWSRDQPAFGRGGEGGMGLSGSLCGHHGADGVIDGVVDARGFVDDE